MKINEEGALEIFERRRNQAGFYEFGIRRKQRSWIRTNSRIPSEELNDETAAYLTNVFLTSASPAIMKLGTMNLPLRSVSEKGEEKEMLSRSSPEVRGRRSRERNEIRRRSIVDWGVGRFGKGGE